ncbi:MAG: diguanylate cyclase protein [Proteobacteria bacterium]|nr:diguanylate cyclase protein [Pseudomonadota bacterium]
MRDQALPSSTLTEQEIQIRQRATAFVFIGMPTLIYFSIVAALDQDWPLTILACATATVVIISYIALWRNVSSYRAIRPAVVSQTILLLYLVTFSGPEHARGLWFLSLPLFSIMLLPPREGGIWALGSTIIAIFLMLDAASIEGGTAYSTAYVIRFSIVSLLISGVVLWSEMLLHRYRERLEGQNAALAAERDRLEHEIIQRTALEEELRYLATTDPLTGLLNRRAFMTALADEITRSKRLHSRFTLLMLDIDHFKVVNDTYGHPAGDAVLAHLSGLMAEQLRSIDRLARIGGEEFAILLVDTSAEAAATVIERLLVAIRNKPTSHPETGKAIAITASIGCTESKAEDNEQSALVRADRALYAAKLAGRDQHCWR